ncbi:MAG: class I SAM-dependent methyltransferase [Acidimicrobiia bacterium]
MTEDRAQVFGRDAAAYERSRPGYPAEAISHLTGLVDARHAVEIGAGTGKATQDVARPGLDLTCLEPSAEMAALLEARGLPGVSVAVTTFEDWEGASGPVELLYAAQSWHWVDRSTAYDKARSTLVDGGALALMWNIPAGRYQFEEVYAEHAPELVGQDDERMVRRDSHDWGDDLRAAGFTDVDRFTHHWSEQLTASQYRSLYSTYSDHIMVPEPRRTRLLDGLERAVSEGGGVTMVYYRTEVFGGRV